MSQGDLYAMALEALTTSQVAVTATPAGAISRAYVSISSPAFDCEQLTVHTASVAKDAPVTGGQGERWHHLRGGSRNIGEFQVVALRGVCAVTEDGRLPTVAMLTADAEQVYADGWSLWNTLSNAIRDNTLWAGFPCRDLAISPLAFVNPQGGLAGCAVSLTAQIDGYVP